MKPPVLSSWALPENWRKGLRPPGRNGEAKPEVQGKGSKSDNSGGNGSVFSQPANGNSENGGKANLTGSEQWIRATSLMSAFWGWRKSSELRSTGTSCGSTGGSTNPKLIRDVAIKQRVLESVARGIERLEAVLQRMDPSTVQAVLAKQQAPPLGQIADIKTLQHVVLGLEELAEPTQPHAA